MLTLSLLQGLEAAAEVERLLQLLMAEKNRAASERQSLVIAHLDTLVTFSDELTLHPVEVQSLLADGEKLAIQHDVTHDQLRDRQHAWRPPRELPEGVELDVLGTTQQEPIVTITLAAAPPVRGG